MRFISIVGAIALTACVSSTSRVGPFVRDIQLAPQGIVVDSCVVQVETTTDYTYWLELRSSEKSHELQQGECYRQVTPMGGIQ
jgi:hypothetical protein